MLPSIDDGSRSVEESLAIISHHYEAGIRTIVATPHIRSDLFFNTRQTIIEAFDALFIPCQTRFPDLTLRYAAEYFGDDHFVSLLENDEILPLFDDYVLVETSMRKDQPFFVEILELMLDKGYKPVLAHPERYRTWWNNKNIYDQVYQMGVIFQVNLLSLAGVYGPQEQETAEILIRQGKISAVGSDLHRPSQYQHILKAVQNPYFSELSSLPLLNRNLL